MRKYVIAGLTLAMIIAVSPWIGPAGLLLAVGVWCFVAVNTL
jgi:hypothetical protein